MPRVLVVDDDPDVRSALRRALVLDGHEVEVAEDGQGCLDALALRQPRIVLLDVMMPGIDGLEVCRRMRAAGIDLPVLMLTARDEVSDRVAGLDAGADDYLVKPFALEELRARMRALLRRPAGLGEGATSSGAPEVLSFEDLQLDLGTCLARRGEREIQLTRTELALLELLMRHPRQVITRAVMYEHVWGYDFGGSSNSHEVYVGYLRRKLEAGGEPRLIQTVRGLGYALRAEA